MHRKQHCCQASALDWLREIEPVLVVDVKKGVEAIGQCTRAAGGVLIVFTSLICKGSSFKLEPFIHTPGLKPVVDGVWNQPAERDEKRRAWLGWCPVCRLVPKAGPDYILLHNKQMAIGLESHVGILITIRVRVPNRVIVSVIYDKVSVVLHLSFDPALAIKLRVIDWSRTTVNY